MKIKLTLLVISLVLSLVSLSAQTTSVTKDGLQIGSISTIHGTVRVNLPGDMMAGDMISGTVRVEPKGTNEKRKSKAAKELSSYSLLIGDNTWNTSQKPQQWTVPNSVTNKQILAKLVDPKGNVISTFPVSVNPLARANPQTFSGVKTPGYLRSGYANELSGNFDGNSANTSVLLDQKPITILAESTSGIICEVPQDISGPNQLTVIENGVPFSTSCNVVGLELSIDKPDLTRGENATVFLTAVGMQNLEVPVTIAMDNFSPQNVNLQGGAHQVLTINQNDVDPDGSFNQNFQLTAYQSGGFDISCVLNSPPEPGINPIDPSETETPDDGLPGLTNPNPFNEELPVTGSEYENGMPGLTNPNPLNGEITVTGSEFEIGLPGLTNPNPFNGELPVTNSTYEIGPNGNAALIDYTIDATVDLNVNVTVPEDDIQEERNKAREIPEDTPLAPRDPDDTDKPYSRPVPPGIRSPEYYQWLIWKDIDKMLEDANEQVEKAEGHKGSMVPGIPGHVSIGTTAPYETIITESEDVTCTEKIYYFYQRYNYLSDRSLLHEEQLSPSHEFFVAVGKSKVEFTETQTGWEVETSATAGSGPFEVKISGKYGVTTTHISGKGSSRIRGRTFWLFHVGRLYLVRKAYLGIEYEYHFEVCSDGSSRNWVNTTYTDNWIYWYEWEEELFVASKDDEGNFHRVNAFPNTIHTQKQGEKSKSYEIESLDRDNFINPHSEEFFPNS